MSLSITHKTPITIKVEIRDRQEKNETPRLKGLQSLIFLIFYNTSKTIIMVKEIIKATKFKVNNFFTAAMCKAKFSV